jgi:hypothetical protein
MAAFRWRVAVDGYRWRFLTYEGEEHPYLAVVPDWNWRFRWYAPLDEFSGLFRIFAQTPTTLEGVQSFANRFGQLNLGSGGVGEELDGSWEIRSNEEWRRYDQTPDDEYKLDPFEHWCEAIVRLRECVETWDRAQGGGVDEQAVEGLRVTVENALRYRTRVSFAGDERVGGFVLRMMPTDLLGGLWLQLAQTISGSKTHRACPVCRDWFEVSLQKYRKSRRYCSEPCRSLAYRGRMEQARKLAGEGKSAKEIARELGSDVKTVKGWLSKRKG